MKNKTCSGFSLPIALTIILLTGMLFECTPETPVYQIGIISGFESFNRIIEGFKAKMASEGFEEGKNIIYKIRYAEADPLGMLEAAEEYVADHVDLIVAFPTETALAAKKAAANSGIPVLFANANTEGSGITDSIMEAGYNITGVRTMLSEQTVKRLEILHELVPEALRIFIPHDPVYPGLEEILSALKNASDSLGIELVGAAIKDNNELIVHLAEMESKGDLKIDAVMIIPTRLAVSMEGFTTLNSFAKRNNLPLAGTLPFMADQGALFNLALDHYKVGEIAGSMAVKIFRGIQARSIPIVTAELSLRINYKRALELGLDIPDHLLLQAVEIIR